MQILLIASDILFFIIWGPSPWMMMFLTSYLWKACACMVSERNSLKYNVHYSGQCVDKCILCPRRIWQP